MATFQWICKRCTGVLGTSQGRWSESRRYLHDRWLQRQYAAELEWKNQADEIRNGRHKGMLDILEERGFVHQITGLELLHLSPSQTANQSVARESNSITF
jgi:hypothetical protein